MSKQAFECSVQGLQEAIAYLQKNEDAVARTTHVNLTHADITIARKKVGLSRKDFASVFGLNAATLRKWENGECHPAGAERALLTNLSHTQAELQSALLESWLKEGAERREKIEQAFRDLKNLKPGYSLHFTTISRLFSLASPMAERHLDNDPRTQGLILSTSKYPVSWTDGTLKGAQKEITEMKNCAKNFQTAVYHSHKNTHIYIVDAGFELGQFVRFLSDFVAMTDKAQENLDDLIRNDPAQAVKPPGKPEKRAPLQIALILADEYHKATGDDPTVSNHKEKIDPRGNLGNKAYGEFFKLVHEVFLILEIKQKAEWYARQAEDLWKGCRNNPNISSST